MKTRPSEKLTEIPDHPKEFGDDGGHFYKCFDELAEECDETLVKNLKAQLDGILIFAGLFAGVNSTFLVFTLPQLSADSADDTNALLLQIALGGNSNITSKEDLPSAKFVPSRRIYLVNVLLSVSLMLALFSSILAVFGQQWIVYYCKRAGGGPEHERWEQLRRYFGAKRWRLELVLDDLVPSLLQIGLVIFCTAFALYLGTLSQSLNRIIVWLLYVAAAIILAMAVCAAYDPCRWMFFPTAMGIINAIWPNATGRQVPAQGEPLGLVKALIAELPDRYRSFKSAVTRSAEHPDDLKIEALRRVMCTSEDRDALVWAAMNLQVLRDERALSSLARDQEFYDRLSTLQEAARSEAQHGRSSGRYSLIESKVLSTSYFHFILSTCSNPYMFRVNDKLAIQVSPIVATDSEEMSHLLQGSVPTSCAQCSHCMTLLFSIRVADIIFKSAENGSLPDLRNAFESVRGKLAGNRDLRLGFMVASVMLIPRQFADEEWTYQNYEPKIKFLKALFAAYRERSERVMFRTISTALTTVTTQWEGKPNHEIYVWLFELCLLPGWKEISILSQHPILERVDDHLLSVESRIRDENASGTDRQQGRDSQNRYVQSVADFFSANTVFSQYLWTLIGVPLERYLGSVAELMEADPGHPENPRTILVLRCMKSSFPAPKLLEGPQDDVWYKRKHERQKKAYSRFCQLVDRVESVRARKVYEAAGLRDQRFYCTQQRGRMWCNQQEPAIHMLAI
ncbi:hypothetical protein FRC00_002965 [Tulasnella sp. 408]|nr:hypothetical protein FRC00_002965 [Tulasnella sp. 408]